MKVITKIDGIELLQMIANNVLECGTMIRHKRDDLILCSNPPQPVYEYYKYTAGDKRFHRCDENGKLGATGQQRFMNYSTLNKTFEIVEMDKEFEIYKMGKTAIYQSADSISISSIIEEEQDIALINEFDDNFLQFETGGWKGRNLDVAFKNKINELIKVVNELKKNER